MVHCMIMPFTLVVKQRQHAATEIGQDVCEEVPIPIDEEGTIRLSLDPPGAGELCGEVAASIGKSGLSGGESTFADLEDNHRHFDRSKEFAEFTIGDVFWSQSC